MEHLDNYSSSFLLPESGRKYSTANSRQPQIKKKMIHPIVIVIALILSLSSISCATTATRSDGETLKIRGIGRAKWPDGAEISGEPMIKLPTIPLEIEK